MRKSYERSLEEFRVVPRPRCGLKPQEGNASGESRRNVKPKRVLVSRKPVRAVGTYAFDDFDDFDCGAVDSPLA